MPIKIALRTGVGLSPFRHMLLQMLHPSTGDSALICSGYIWEPKGGAYQVLADDLLNAIDHGCPNGVITVAGKLGGGHYKSFYANFVARIGAVKPIHFDLPFGLIDAVINPRVLQLSEGEQLQRLYDHIMHDVVPFKSN